jgi:uncharacterized protein with PIN domain
MMIKEIFLQLLEQDEHGDVLVLAKQNVVVSFFDKEKKINVAPFSQAKEHAEVRKLVSVLREKFKVFKVLNIDMNVFQVTFSAAQDFGKVREFLKQQGHKK